VPGGTRWIDCTDVDNLRDLGGLPVKEGGAVRRGVLYRASTLQEASPGDVDTITRILSIRTVIDLRRTDEFERDAAGPWTATDVELIHLPMAGPDRAMVSSNPQPRTVDVDLAGAYAGFLVSGGPSIVAAARLVADTARRPLLFHCAAGKDRTGVLAAILLDAVGVPRSSIADDYALTGPRMERVRARLTRLGYYRHMPHVDDRWFCADADTMRAFLIQLHEDHGGGAAWLRRQGLTDLELAALRDALIDPHAQSSTSRAE
jgi:protein-tyrosine phosphatase